MNDSGDGMDANDLHNFSLGIPEDGSDGSARHDQSSQDYLRRAAAAVEKQDSELGMHLYITAFERATHESSDPGLDAIEGLKTAWDLACERKERALAEYIFEKLSPYLDSSEIGKYSAVLQSLAMDKLAEFGLTSDTIKQISGVVIPELLDGQGIPGMPNVTIVSGKAGPAGLSISLGKPLSVSGGTPAHVGVPAQPGAPAQGSSDASAAESQSRGSAGAFMAPTHPDKPVDPTDNADITVVSDHLRYSDLVGYNSAINDMRKIGIGMQDDPAYQDFIKMLNMVHGLEKPPAIDTILVRSDAREDASRFLLATMGEMNLPGLRMYIEDGPFGAPILCVVAMSDGTLKMNQTRTEFLSPAVLILEDIDTWVIPPLEVDPEDIMSVINAHLTRAAKDALLLIRNAVENPDVIVLASCGDVEQIDPFFADFLLPFTVVDIERPDAGERAEIWYDIVTRHSSMYDLDKVALVNLSASLSRYDIAMAAREAIDEAYKESLITRTYTRVSPENIFEKIAAFQPLSSDEYKELENRVVKDFSRDLDFDKLLGYADDDNIEITPELLEDYGVDPVLGFAVPGASAVSSQADQQELDYLNMDPINPSALPMTDSNSLPETDGSEQ